MTTSRKSNDANRDVHVSSLFPNWPDLPGKTSLDDGPITKAVDLVQITDDYQYIDNRKESALDNKTLEKTAAVERQAWMPNDESSRVKTNRILPTRGQNEEDARKETLRKEFITSSDPEKVGELIRYARQQSKLSQSQLIAEMPENERISLRTLSRLECGDGPPPKIGTLNTILEAAGGELTVGFRLT